MHGAEGVQDHRMRGLVFLVHAFFFSEQPVFFFQKLWSQAEDRGGCSLPLFSTVACSAHLAGQPQAHPGGGRSGTE